jgi:hypothetical protein
MSNNFLEKSCQKSYRYLKKVMSNNFLEKSCQKFYRYLKKLGQITF